MRRILLRTLAFGAAVLTSAAVFGQAGKGLTIPTEWEHWYLVNSMIVTKDSPQSEAIGGLHHVFVNPVGFPRLTRGGSDPYPDGTVFVDDVRDFGLLDGSYQQGKRKAIPVMVKDSRKFATTGGWGFQAWAEGDPKKPLVGEPIKACFECHASQAANDYVFSTYLR